MKLNRDNVDAIQGACNPIATANQFAEWVTEAYKQGITMDQIKENELLLGVLGKLCDLFRLDHDGERAYKYMSK